MTKRRMVMVAMFAALTALLSQVVIPIGTVPMNLALVSVFIAGGLLGWKDGAMSQIIFALMGLVGLPVFAGFRGGVGAMLGPTGGFIIGYILCAAISKKSMLAGLAATYAMGLSWYMFIMGAGFVDAIMVCVIPFLIGDFVKIMAAKAIVRRMQNGYKRNQGVNESV